MRFSVFLAGLFLASDANAHVGHLGELAGHDHRIAAGAIGIAIAVAGWNALKGKKIKKQRPKSRSKQTQKHRKRDRYG